LPAGQRENELAWRENIVLAGAEHDHFRLPGKEVCKVGFAQFIDSFLIPVGDYGIGEQPNRCREKLLADPDPIGRDAANHQGVGFFPGEFQRAFPLPSLSWPVIIQTCFTQSKVPVPYNKSAAIVVLPAVGGARLANPGLKRWLARADLKRLRQPEELLGTILARLGLPCPESGHGALRMWGQTGDRPTVWIAAADPVYLEPRLDHLCLHAQDAQSAPASDLGPLFDHLQATLGDNEAFGFAQLQTCGYLRAANPVATATVPPSVVHQDMPNRYMPSGEGAARFRQLVSEIEMALHEHDVNIRRQENGEQPINGLWLWGGGFAPEQETVPHPPLFSDDPLLTGYWMSKTGVVTGWPGDIRSCIDASVAGFVAVIPEHDDPGLLERVLSELREQLKSGRLSRLTLMFRDGIEATVRRGHRRRWWRRGSPLLD
jgi:hypothetical protein